MLRLNKNFFEDNKNLILFSCGVAIFLSFISSFIILALFIILTSSFIFIHGKKILLGIIIIGYLTTPTEYFGESRVYINLFLSCLLVLLFIQEFGFSIENYTKIPKEILFFLFFLLFSLIISTILSSDPLTGFFTIITLIAFFIIGYFFYAFLKNEENIFVYIYSIYIVVTVFGIRMFIDLYMLGFQDYFFKAMLKGKIEMYGSSGYTGLIIFFVSISFTTCMLLMNKYKKKVHRYFFSLFLLFNLLILILANSRSGIIAALLSISFIFFIVRKSLFIKIFTPISLIIVMLYFTIPIFEETVDFYSRWETINTRDIFWESGIDVIKDYPYFGIGPNLFSKNFSSYAPSNVFKHFESERLVSAHPHNFFIFYTAESGVLGLLISITFFVLFFYFGFKTIKLSRKMDENYFILSTAITGIGIGIFFRSFFEVTGYLFYGYITTDLPFWLIFGILISIYKKLKNSSHKFLYNYKFNDLF